MDAAAAIATHGAFLVRDAPATIHLSLPSGNVRRLALRSITSDGRRAYRRHIADSQSPVGSGYHVPRNGRRRSFLRSARRPTEAVAFPRKISAQSFRVKSSGRDTNPQGALNLLPESWIMGSFRMRCDVWGPWGFPSTSFCVCPCEASVLRLPAWLSLDAARTGAGRLRCRGLGVQRSPRFHLDRVSRSVPLNPFGIAITIRRRCGRRPTDVSEVGRKKAGEGVYQRAVSYMELL